ncbi:uncharacterized protein [Diabrotica undecimpunctata]|uniref:uncharacterized protein n=1 Tax=Diabrotica undecimpunctata TaxID=50387 RepID=UPI003B6332FF
MLNCIVIIKCARNILNRCTCPKETKGRPYLDKHIQRFSRQYSKHTDKPIKKVIRLEGTTEIDNVHPVAINNPTDDKHSTIPDTLMEEFLVTDADVNRQEVSTPHRHHTPQSFTPYAQSSATQTPSKLCGGTPRKSKMRLKIKTLLANVKKACTSSKKMEDDIRLFK